MSVYLYDGHGSVVGLANESGVVTDTYSYDAFGNLLKSKGSTKNCYRYCGEQFDETTGLYYLRARYMDTSTGRFISQDTYQGDIKDPVSLHKYLYCNSDPVNNIDPSGYSTKEKEITQTVILLPAFFLTIGYIAEHKYNEQVIRQGISIIRALQVLKPLIVYTSIWGAAISAMMPDIISGDSTSLDTSEKILETVIDNTLPRTKKDKDNDFYLYYEAEVSYGDGAIVYDNKPLSLKEAIKRIIRGEDIFCISMMAAETLAVGFGGLTEREPRPNSRGRLNGDAYHYHVRDTSMCYSITRNEKSHIFVDEGIPDELLHHKLAWW